MQATNAALQNKMLHTRQRRLAWARAFGEINVLKAKNRKKGKHNGELEIT